MKHNSGRRAFFALVALVFVAMAATGCTVVGDPLPSWNDTAPKKAIIAFVKDVTDTTSAFYVPPEERIATFDNDGTLWTEQPMPPQLFFALHRIKAMAPSHPEWREQEPFRSALAGDMVGLLRAGKEGMRELVLTAGSGMTTDEFARMVRTWIAEATHPLFDRPFTETVYQPMLELLAYLRANGFKTYIVSGGSADFMRVWTEDVYGIPPEQVVGSSVVTRFEMRDGTPVLIREPKIFFVDDGEGKAIGIQKFIGRRPLAAFGNADADLQMIQWTTAGGGPRLGMFVHHTDGEREVAYDRVTLTGKLDNVLETARANGWIIIDMKRDWKRVFPAQRRRR